MSSLEFQLKIIAETRTYLLDKIKNNVLISEKYKKTCRYLNYIEHLLTLVSTITSYVSFSPFTSLVAIPVGITSSVVGLKICAIIAGIKRYK